MKPSSPSSSSLGLLSLLLKENKATLLPPTVSFMEEKTLESEKSPFIEKKNYLSSLEQEFKNFQVTVRNRTESMRSLSLFWFGGERMKNRF